MCIRVYIFQPTDYCKHTIKIMVRYILSKINNFIKTHSCVSVTKKDAQAHKCVIYTTGQIANFSLS